MTDVVTLDRPGPAGARCANCGAALHGPFCAACGQADHPLDPPTREFAKEFAQEFLDVDSRVLRSLRRLVFSPGFLTREHVEGRRTPWFTPLKLYLLTSVAAFAVLTFAGDDAGLKIALTKGPADPQAAAAAIDEARAIWVPRVVFVLVPFFAWLVARVRRRSGRNYPSHFVFALHVHAAFFVTRTAVTAVTLVFPPAAKPYADGLLNFYLIGYLFLAFRTAYGDSSARAARDTALVGIVYMLGLTLVAGVVVLGAAFGPRILVEFFR
jgi:Protein of unknown function (DUF3667)